MRVSVIIPAFKAAHTIARAVDSVLTQTSPTAEVIVVDDGSPDDIASALVPYGDRVTLIRKPNGGAASARNLGIERATGEFIAFLDADDYWEPWKLERQLAVFQRHPEVGLVAGNFYSQDMTGARVIVMASNQRKVPFETVLELDEDAAFRAAISIWTGVLMVRRRVLGNERFVPGLEPAEDRDLWIRLVTKAPIYFVSEPLVTGVLEPGSLSRTYLDRDCGNMLRVVRRHAMMLGPSDTKKWECYVYRRWAGSYLASGNPRRAVTPAMSRLAGEPFSAEAWWIACKSLALAMVRSIRKERR
jgi:glycosyltransferase involved in cell wall biosynthesis